MPCDEGWKGCLYQVGFRHSVLTAAGGVFAYHKASAVGKARRPFIRLSEKQRLSNNHVADLGKCLSGARAKRKDDEASDRETLAQGDLEVVAGRRAGWAALLTGKKLTRGTKGQLFERQHCRTALGRQG